MTFFILTLIMAELAIVIFILFIHHQHFQYFNKLLKRVTYIKLESDIDEDFLVPDWYIEKQRIKNEN